MPIHSYDSCVPSRIHWIPARAGVTIKTCNRRSRRSQDEMVLLSAQAVECLLSNGREMGHVLDSDCQVTAQAQ